jgi:hypothetical protein
MSGKKHIVSISGSARSGKDTLADNFVSILKASGIKSQKLSFAYELKKDVDKFLIEQLGISAFTENSDEKSLIRPFLVTWGTDVMRAKDPRVWIKKLEGSLVPDAVNIIADLRFENELEWVKENNGLSLFIDRNDILAANKYERKNNEILKKQVDLFFNMAYLEDSNILKAISTEILSNLINQEIFDSWKATCPL